MMTPQNTAKPHPMVMTIQPEFWALGRASRTPATTPSPRRISAPVPRTSAKNFSTMLLSFSTGRRQPAGGNLPVLLGNEQTRKKSTPRHHHRDGDLSNASSRGLGVSVLLLATDRCQSFAARLRSGSPARSE